MRIGYCTNMNATGRDGTGIECIEALAAAGFDYVELPLAQMAALSDAAFEALVERVRRAGIRCETSNNFFPANLRLTGPAVHWEAVLQYAQKALARAGRLGVSCVVFGSGPAKHVPPGFSLEKGYWQVVELLQAIDPVARENGVYIAIEPLRKAECNLINTYREGCCLARDVNREHIRVLVDYYHLMQENEPVRHIVEGAHCLRHVHFARNKGRGFPRAVGEEAYTAFRDALRAAGYNGTVSLEAYCTDFDAEAPAALAVLRELFAH